MGKYKFNVGDKLGPNQLELLERTRKNARGEWYGYFICPYCHQQFEAMISRIASGHTKSCGCLVAHDVTNQIFGRLTALYPVGKTKNGTTLWHCRCSCGNEKDIRITSLLNGETQSCGCLRTDLKALDLTNQKFGHLTALFRLPSKDKWDNFYWECECDCGRRAQIPAHSLVSGNTQSCGACQLASREEEKIANILNELNISFINEKTFEDCRNPRTGHKLRFDFYLQDLNILIEYDGEQHFHYRNNGWSSMTEEGFKDLQFRDEYKNQYCIDNNIPLIRIPYTHKHLISKEYILTQIKQITSSQSHDRYGIESEGDK